MATKIIDKENMREVINKSAGQFATGLDLAKNIKIQGTFKSVVICGMGGSALPGDILSYLLLPKAPIYIHKDYNLPAVANEDSLVVCISYSGNTEETVSSLQECINKNITCVAIASGGKLGKIAEEHNIPLVKIPSGIQPRSATGYLFSALIGTLINCNIVEDVSEEILNTAEELTKINTTLEKEGKILAKRLDKKIPLVYASSVFQTIAKIWKIKFNENSKIPAFTNFFPELNHNEMVGFTGVKKTSGLHLLIIKDSADHPRTIKRMELTSLLLKKKGVKTDFIETKQGTLMFRMFSSLLLGDWVSYYLAINNNIDPTPVDMVEEFKVLLNK